MKRTRTSLAILLGLAVMASAVWAAAPAPKFLPRVPAPQFAPRAPTPQFAERERPVAPVADPPVPAVQPVQPAQPSAGDDSCKKNGTCNLYQQSQPGFQLLPGFRPRYRR